MRRSTCGDSHGVYFAGQVSIIGVINRIAGTGQDFAGFGAEALTNREREVMARVVAGEPNKVIARNLDLSAKTIEAHRAAVMRKMEADSLASLVHMAIACEDPQEQG